MLRIDTLQKLLIPVKTSPFNSKISLAQMLRCHASMKPWGESAAGRGSWILKVTPDLI